MWSFRVEGKPSVIALGGAPLHEKPYTLKSIIKALELGASAIYLTVYLTKDEIPIALPTDDLSKVYGVEGKVSSLNVGEVRNYALKVGGEVLLIGDVVKVVKGKAKLVIGLGHEDLKSLTRVLDVVQSSNYIENSGIVIHEPMSAKAVKDKYKDVKVILYLSNPYPNLAAIKRLGINAILMPYSLIRSRVVKEAHARGIEVAAMTVNDPAVYVRLVSLGVDAIVTERPEIAREAEGLI